jgi:hypothetical protein
MPDMTDVYSSHVNQIGYDHDTSELHVVWDTGRASVYSEVPAVIARAVIRSWSVGTSLTEAIKGKYAHRYADQPGSDGSNEVE